MFQRRSKYSNKKTEVDSFIFDSKKEAARYQQLRILEKAGEIADLRMQVKYHCTVNGKKVCTYIADFEYTTPDLKVHTEDVKGYRTKEYRLKKKLVEALFNIAIEEV